MVLKNKLLLMGIIIKKIGVKIYENFDNVTALDLLIYSVTVNTFQSRRQTIQNCKTILSNGLVSKKK